MKRKQKRKHLESTHSHSCAKKPRVLPDNPEDTPHYAVLNITDSASVQTSAENVCVSECFSFVSSAIKLPLADENASKKKKRRMNIFYLPVQMKRGVADLWSDLEEEEAPSTKKIKIQQVTFAEQIRSVEPLSYVSTEDLLTDSESQADTEIQEEGEEADCPAEHPASEIEECSRAQTPDWLVTPDRGLRCMACCRVFSNLDALRKHVEHGVKEGFSCHVFHHAMAKIRNRNMRQKKKVGKRAKRRKSRR